MIEANKNKCDWSLRTCQISLSSPKIMGILNITPDSFSDGGLYFNTKKAVARALQIQSEGADLIDIGAESTRPGAIPLGWKEEWTRMGPVLKILNQELSIPISVDTYKSEVALEALNLGVEVINDVSCAADPALLQAVAEANAAYILMHSRGTPQTMMNCTEYSELAIQVLQEMQTAIQKIIAAHISPAKICIDPGFGFAKTSEQNYQLLQSISQFTQLNYPVMIGVSKKRMLKEIVGGNAEDLKIATISANLLACQSGVKIFRVHDVQAHVTAFKVMQKLIDYPIL